MVDVWWMYGGCMVDVGCLEASLASLASHTLRRVWLARLFGGVVNRGFPDVVVLFPEGAWERDWALL